MKQISLDPEIAIWLNIAYAVLTGLTAPMLQAAGVAEAQQVVAWAAIVALPVNVILHAYSSTVPGPLAPPDNPRVKPGETPKA